MKKSNSEGVFQGRLKDSAEERFQLQTLRSFKTATKKRRALKKKAANKGHLLKEAV